MADESCSDEHDAERLIELDACDMFNIKLGKTGYFKALEDCTGSEKAGIHLQVGAMLESRIAMTAFCPFLPFVIPFIQHFDFDIKPLMFREDPSYRRYTIFYGVWKVPDTAGARRFN